MNELVADDCLIVPVDPAIPIRGPSPWERIIASSLRAFMEQSEAVALTETKAGRTFWVEFRERQADRRRLSPQ